MVLKPAVITALGAIIVASFGSPALAAHEPSTKLVRCGAQSCLVVTGHRDDPAATVSINGRAVEVEGKRGWRASLPVETVRRWSAPFARTLDISLQSPGAEQKTTTSVDLPIGLLGHVTDLASLEIRVR